MSRRAGGRAGRDEAPLVPGFRDKTVQRADKARWKRKSDPSQNLHVERGAAVTLDEVLAHRLQGHEACRGRGLGKDGRPCACATKKFFKAHPEMIVDASGCAWHPASKKPAPSGIIGRHWIEPSEKARARPRSAVTSGPDPAVPTFGEAEVRVLASEPSMSDEPADRTVERQDGGEISGVCSHCGKLGAVSPCMICAGEGKRFLVCVGTEPDPNWEHRCRRAHVRREVCGL